MAGNLVTRNITVTSQGANGSTITSTYQVTGNAESNLSQTIPPSSTNAEYDLVVNPYTGVQSADFENISSGTMTLKFNSSGAPVPQIVLTANQMIHWDVAQYAGNNTLFPCPYTQNVTKVYVTSTPGGTLNISNLLITGP